jgi:glycolate oxidase FAD binding subunit
MNTFYARTVEEVQDCVRTHGAIRGGRDAAVPQGMPSASEPAAREAAGGGGLSHLALRPVAGRSKSALSGAAAADAACDVIDLSAISGVIDYQPDECTFSARAATPVREIEEMLAKHGQYLPFEPPFVGRGATLCGTVAAGLSGPGRFRYGGVRDFLLGVRFVDGEGRAIRGGGRVVKNAAGFYLQHLLLGSLGTLGVLTEVTFKVFPQPQTRTTIVADHETLDAAIDTLARVRRSTFELESVEIVPPARLLLRIGGSASAMNARVNNLSTWLRSGGRNSTSSGTTGRAAEVRVHQIADADEERQCWHEARDLTWAPAGVPLVKIATTLGRLGELDRRLAGATSPARTGAAPGAIAGLGTDTGAGAPLRRYGAGGDVAWVAWPHPLPQLDAMLTELQMPGLLVQAGAERTGATASDSDAHSKASAASAPRLAPPRDPMLGPRPDAAFLARVRRTLDPRGVFTPPHD